MPRKNHQWFHALCIFVFAYLYICICVFVYFVKIGLRSIIHKCSWKITNDSMPGTQRNTMNMFFQEPSFPKPCNLFWPIRRPQKGSNIMFHPIFQIKLNSDQIIFFSKSPSNKANLFIAMSSMITLWHMAPICWDKQIFPHQ